MEPYRITYDELAPYFVAVNTVLGVLFGIFPLIAGLMLKNRKYGAFGFVGSVIGGALLGVFLSFPIAAVFLWLIVRKVPDRTAVETISNVSEAPRESEGDSTGA